MEEKCTSYFPTLACVILLRDTLIGRGDDSFGRVARYHYHTVGVPDDHVTRGDRRATADDRNVDAARKCLRSHYTSGLHGCSIELYLDAESR